MAHFRRNPCPTPHWRKVNNSSGFAFFTSARSFSRHWRIAGLPLLRRPLCTDGADMHAASQSRRFWITGVKANMLFADKQGRMWNLTEWLRSLPQDQQVADVWVRAGKREQVPV